MPRRWITQLNEIARAREKTQYVCIALLHHIRRNDRLSLDKLIDDLLNSRISSLLAKCLVIKMAAAKAR